MSSWARGLLAALLLVAGPVQAQQAQQSFPGIGRDATPREIAAWDIDVRPDFRGLPPGRGSVAQGQVIWEAKCASCHGVFGESNSTFFPIVGGTTADDVNTGRVARLTDRAYPSRTTLMKLPTLSTLWDYIHRAMPWNEPKSLKPDEVYAVTAYILNLGGVLPDDFVLSDANVRQVQQRLPNRNGMRSEHALWPGAQRKPDVADTACMQDCLSAAPRVVSSLPDFARNAHGNLAEQNRLVGAQRGQNTGPAATSDSADAQLKDLLTRHNCSACHGVDNRIVGPSFREVAARHAGRTDVVDYLAGKIRSGGSGLWGSIPMPPQTLDETEAALIARWLATGAGAR